MNRLAESSRSVPLGRVEDRAVVLLRRHRARLLGGLGGIVLLAATGLGLSLALAGGPPAVQEVGCVPGQSASCAGAHLAGAHLAGTNLAGRNLKRADLSGADLVSTNLSGDDLSGADLKGADLKGADLNGADLKEADLDGANLTAANLDHAQLRNARLSGATLCHTVMPDGHMDNAGCSKGTV
ncbi:MAG: pentapeptide repeat-containing protein [Acidimicrobiales bacterium]